MDQTCIYGQDLPLAQPICRLGLSSCIECGSKLTIDQPDLAAQFVDPLVILDRRRAKTSVLRDLLAGRSAFLLCGGPSANELPLEQLSERGIWVLAVNNAAGHPRVRAQAMICSDPPKKFSHSIWLDPGVMKFVPTPKLNGRRGILRQKTADGFEPLGLSTTDCPNVWAYQRYSWFQPDASFFLADGACWGNHAKGVEQTKQPKTVCTMLLALRLLIYLGAHKIYLIGVDFQMSPDYGYSFEQERDSGAAESNNRQYAVVNEWLCQMQHSGVFAKFGVEIYNLYNRSGLRAFDYLPFDDALAEAQSGVEKVPDLAGWYDPVK